MTNSAGTGTDQTHDLMYVIYETMNRSPYPIMIGESKKNPFEKIEIIYANQKFCELASVVEGSLTNQDLFKVLENFIEIQPLEQIKKKLRTDGFVQDELWFVSPASKDDKYQRITISQLESGQAENIHYSVFFNDITGKKALAEKLISNHRSSTLALMINGFAHDLNNLLSPVINTFDYLGTLEKYQGDKQYFNTALKSAKQASSLIDKMLSFSRGDVSEKSSVDLRDLIKELVQILTHTLPKNINISTEFPPVLSRIKADHTLIYQVLLNLCLNSAEAMPDGGDLRLYAGEIEFTAELSSDYPGIDPGKYVKISVEDTGAGIPEEKRSKVFEPIFSLKESKLGLGLFTCREILNEHGGHIDFTSRTGTGTRFDLYFPAYVEEEHQKNKLSGKSDVQDHFLKYCGNGETILLVDDEEAIKQTIGMILNKCNYNVITASDGAEALKKYIENIQQIKLAILDIVMPVMDGPTAAKALKKYNKDLKIILTTGFEGHQSIEKSAGDIDRFIRKPYTSIELLEIVSALLG